ncbi:MAG: MgtC/SapB family protein [Candidatus Izemoplasma sp.]|nr:MgtC/SapB family protein [Candidatus Izemoplasma sp.]
MDIDIDFLNILQSLGLTLFFVGLIGYERQRKHKIAGMTTHLMVAFGATALSIIQEYMVADSLQYIRENPEFAQNIVIQRQRLIAQVVAGVGFLGTGAIIKTNGYITGLTTASTLWISAIIGMTFGLGYNLLGITTSLFALMTLYIIKRVTREKLDIN